MLEAYHVVLLQRAPCIYGTLLIPLVLDAGDSHSSPNVLETSRTISAVLDVSLNPHLHLFSTPGRLAGSFCLSSLALLSWHARLPLYSDTKRTTFWRLEHIELALHRWFHLLQSPKSQIDPALAILFHMIFISMGVNMDIVHGFVAARLSMSTCRDEALQKSRLFLSSDGQVTCSHASTLLDVANDLILSQLQLSAVSDATSGASSRERTNFSAEAPHLAACIYTASVLLWVANQIGELGRMDRQQGEEYLEKGIHLLSHLNSRMAKKLCRSLVRLFSPARGTYQFKTHA